MMDLSQPQSPSDFSEEMHELSLIYDEKVSLHPDNKEEIQTR
jgi:hypothetical protein